MSFGKRVKELRKSKNWSQAELSNKIDVHQTMVAQYENDLKFPSSEKLITIAKIFDVSLDYLMGISKNKIRFDEEEMQNDPDLFKIVNATRPTIKGVPVSDSQWDMITTFLGSVIKQLEEQGKLPKTDV